MTDREQEIRQKIIAYITKHNRCPNFRSVGTDWTEGNPIFKAMIADGTLVWAERLSPKGRKMSILRLGDK